MNRYEMLDRVNAAISHLQDLRRALSDECPAGGAHSWELHEEAGTGRTGWACAECHAPMPADYDSNHQP